MQTDQTFLIHPSHGLAKDALVTVKKLISEKVQYAIVQGVQRDGNQKFKTVIPTDSSHHMAVGLKRWLKTYREIEG